MKIPGEYSPSHVELAGHEERGGEVQQTKKHEPLTAQQVIIKDIDIDFWDLVILFIKIAFAAIPAAIFVAIIWGMIIFFWAGLGRAARVSQFQIGFVIL